MYVSNSALSGFFLPTKQSTKNSELDLGRILLSQEFFSLLADWPHQLTLFLPRPSAHRTRKVPSSSVTRGVCEKSLKMWPRPFLFKIDTLHVPWKKLARKFGLLW
jgi:hypothetical protein